MRWSWRNIMTGTSAAVAAIGLAVALVVVLAGRGVPPAAPKPSPGRSSQLYSPFTGEPMTSLGPDGGWYGWTARPRARPKAAR
jgi:hypothetical protein